MSFQLSPRLYHLLVRPKFFSRLYIHNVINTKFNFEHKFVVDFGSGTGFNSINFHPANYLGLDIDTDRIDFARKQFPGYHFEVLRGKNLPVPDNSVDYIISVAVLHHIPNIDLHDYISEFRRILKTTGQVLALEPCYRHNTPFNNWFMKSFDNGRFIRDEHGYLSLFEKEGFKTCVRKRFKKIFYNELFWSATLN